MIYELTDFIYLIVLLYVYDGMVYSWAVNDKSIEEYLAINKKSITQEQLDFMAYSYDNSLKCCMIVKIIFYAILSSFRLKKLIIKSDSEIKLLPQDFIKVLIKVMFKRSPILFILLLLFQILITALITTLRKLFFLILFAIASQTASASTSVDENIINVSKKKMKISLYREMNKRYRPPLAF